MKLDALTYISSVFVRAERAVHIKTQQQSQSKEKLYIHNLSNTAKMPLSHVWYELNLCMFMI